MPGSQRIKGQSRLVNYNLSPLGGAGLGVPYTPAPPPRPEEGAFRRKLAFSRRKVLVGVGVGAGEATRSSSVLAAN